MSELHENANRKVVSAEGMKKLEEKLKEMTTTGRAAIAEKLNVARGYGDLSENAEYDAAKDEQVNLEREIMELEQTIRTALPAEQKRHDECAAEHKRAKAYAEQLSKESAAKENEANGYAMKLRSRTEKREAIAARLAAADAEAESDNLLLAIGQSRDDFGELFF